MRLASNRCPRVEQTTRVQKGGGAVGLRLACQPIPVGPRVQQAPARQRCLMGRSRRMRRLATILVLALGLMLVSAQASLAASPHFKHGGEPKCTITFTSAPSATVTCTATLAGLGNADVLVTTSVSGTAVYQCQNNGGQIAPGQNKVLVGPATSTTSIPASQVKNGNLTFTTNPAVLTAPTTVSGAAAGCPNPNWTGVNPTLTLTDITLDIYQPFPTLIFHCTASDSNGLTSPVTLTCV